MRDISADEEDEEDKEDKTPLFFLVINPRKRVRIPLEMLHMDYGEEDYTTIPELRTCINGGVLRFFLDRFVSDKKGFMLDDLYRNPHPLVVETILSEFKKHGRFSPGIWRVIAANPNEDVIQMVRTSFPDRVEGPEDFRFLHSGIWENPNPMWADYILTHPPSPMSTQTIGRLFANPDPRIIDWVWNAVCSLPHTERCMAFSYLSINDHPRAVEHILADFDKYRLYQYRFVNSSKNEEVLKKCLQPSPRYVSDFHPEEVVVDYIFNDPRMRRDDGRIGTCSGDLVRNVNDRIVDWLMKECPPEYFEANLLDVFRNNNPRVARVCADRLRGMPWEEVENLVSRLQSNIHVRDVLSPVYSHIHPETMTTIVEMWASNGSKMKLNASFVLRAFMNHSEDEIEVIIE